MTKKSRRARKGRKSRGHHPAVKQSSVAFEAMEPRLLLSAIVDGDYLDEATGSADEAVITIDWNDSEAEVWRDEWIIRYDDLNVRERIGLELQVDSTFGRAASLQEMYTPGYAVMTTPGLSTEEVQDWAKSNGLIEYLSPNLVLRATSVPDDPGFDGQWGLSNTAQDELEYDDHYAQWKAVMDTAGVYGVDIDAQHAWELTTGSNDVVIAVLDTGIDYTHPDLAANIWMNPGEVGGTADYDDDGNGKIDDFYGWDFINDDNAPMDDNFHGTHCAGIIGAVGNNGIGITGVNWSIKLMPVKMLGANGSGTLSAAIDAFNYVTDLKENRGIDEIIATSNSWSSGYSSTQGVLDAIEASCDAGILAICAAGNSGLNGAEFPALHGEAGYGGVENIISVAAMDSYGQLAYFSNYDVGVDIAAPGVDILSTFPTYETAEMADRGFGTYYETISGTSMACPQVAGVVGLLAAYDSGATAEDIRDAILAGTDPMPDMDGLSATQGSLNAYKAMLALDSDGPVVTNISPWSVAMTVDTITVTFDTDIAAASVIPGNIELRRAGSDGYLDTGDDVIYTIIQNDLSQPENNQIEIDLGSNLTTDTYRLTLIGTGGTPIRDDSSNPLNNGADEIYRFNIVDDAAYEANDTISTATSTGLTGAGSASFEAHIGDMTTGLQGDGQYIGADVDMYSLSVSAGDIIIAEIDTSGSEGDLDSYVRIFNSGGTELVANDDYETFDSYVKFTASSAGTYYIGVSGYGNDAYSATTAYDPSTSDPNGALHTGYFASFGGYELAVTVEAAPTPTTGIAGTLWYDADADGTQDSGELALQDWTVFLDTDEDGELDGGETSVVTDANGEYLFEDPGTGTYRVAIVLPDGWEQTSPTPNGYHTVVVGASQVVTDVDFGNRLDDTNFVVNSLADYAVDYLGDLTDMTLRTAVVLASGYSGAVDITFATELRDGVIAFSKMDSLDIDGEVNIAGLGSEHLTIDGSSLSRIFTIEASADATISDLTIANGYFVGLGASGGGILVSGDLTLTDAVIRDSVSIYGAGLFVEDGGSATISSCLFEGNLANFGGGGIGAESGATLDLSDSHITGNSTAASLSSGGGIDISSGVTASIDNCLIDGNSAMFDGGGIDMRSGTLSNSTVINNTAYLTGGGIEAHDAVIENCLVAGNSTSFTSTYDSEEYNGRYYGGGGIRAFGDTIIQNTTISGNSTGDWGGGLMIRSATEVAVINCTITDNESVLDGGGLYLDTSDHLVHNTIVAGNSTGAGAEETDTADHGGSALDSASSYNLFGVGSSTIGLSNGTNGNQIGTEGTPIDPLLGELADNGGPTQTHALAYNSSAIDAGNNSVASTYSLTTDSRGYGRVVDGDHDTTSTADIGAYELQLLVSTTTDESDADYSYGDLSLREALALAASESGLNAIEFDSSLGSTITLSQALGDLDITSDLDILGPGTGNLTISGNDQIRVFNQTTGNTSSIEGLTITGGSGGSGGAMLTQGTMTLRDCIVTGNTASLGGGGIYSDGDLTLENTTIDDNSTSGSGGGVYNHAGDLTVIDSTISNNTSASGGGISSSSYGEDVLITGTTLSGNNGTYSGGGLDVVGGTAIVTDSAVTSNSALFGGGVATSGGDATLINVTLGENIATIGGGIANGNSGSELLAINVTVADNTAYYYGGGISVSVSAGATTLHNTIVAGNDVSSSPDDVYGTFDSDSSYNLIGVIDGSSNLTGTGTQYGSSGTPLDAGLADLANYGGTTETFMLLPGSAAIDAGSNDVARDAGLLEDQRGWSRLVDGDYDGTGIVDVGAHEAPDTILVTSDGDEDDGDYSYGDLTLREALDLAGDASGDDVIGFDESIWGETITLSQGDLDIDSNVAIEGPGAAVITVDGNDSSGVFNQTSGNTSSISGLTITGGSATYGAGVYSAGTLTLTDCIVTDNSGYFGGGIYSTGDLTLENVTVSENSGITGPGIQNAGGDLTISESLITGNSGSDGGGIYNVSSTGDVVITDTVISGNTGASGGGIYTNNSTVSITSSSLVGNTGNSGGGGLYVSGGSVTLGNVTIANNTATGPGGGILNAGTLEAVNVTIAGNSASFDGGGVYHSSGTTTLHNTIVAGNKVSTSDDDVSGTFDSDSSYNLIGAIDGSTNLTGTGTQYGSSSTPLDAGLDILGRFGGPTLTYSLLAGSTAIDAGSNSEASSAGLDTDQRGFDRVLNGTVDIGAYEAVV